MSELDDLHVADLQAALDEARAIVREFMGFIATDHADGTLYDCEQCELVARVQALPWAKEPS